MQQGRVQLRADGFAVYHNSLASLQSEGLKRGRG